MLEGRSSIAEFRDRPGVIDAQILEDAGCIVMTKTCEKHGNFRDVLSTNPDFFKRMESPMLDRISDASNRRLCMIMGHHRFEPGAA